jgi:hypothetical protein
MRKQYTAVEYNKSGQKRCTQCLEYKDKNEFHKFSKAPDGLKQLCKICVREYDLIKNAPKKKFPNKINKNGEIHCRNCGKYFKEEEMKQAKSGKYKTLSYCKECSPLLYRTRLVEKYGITIEQYHQMLEKQNYSCKICGKKESTDRKRLSIDHDHSCCSGAKACGGCVRGLICHHCNSALGNAKDSVEILQKMIDYLS